MQSLLAAGGTGGLGVVFALTTLPEIVTTDGNFGVEANSFGFNFTGVAGEPVVVEAASNLGAEPWLSLQTNALTTVPAHFSDPDWSNDSSRYYRLRIAP